jgi:hypothetical protein
MTPTVLHPGQGKLQRFADGASGPAETRRLARHLAACPRCRADVAFRRELADDARRIPVPSAPAEVLRRVLEERAAGQRVILPGGEDRAPSRPRTRWIAAAAALAAAVAAVAVWQGTRPSVPTSPDEGLPTLHAGWLATPAYAAEPGVVPPVTGIDGSRVRPGRWTYEIRAVRAGRVVGGVERGAIEIRAARMGAAPAWSVSDGWWGHPHDMSETTLMDARTLAPLHRLARDVGHSRFTVEQWFTADSIRGTMKTATRTQVIARRLPVRGAPFFAGEGSMLPLMRSVRLHPRWQGSLSTLGWGAVESDLSYPLSLRVAGEGRIRIPSGTFDCWRVLAGTGPRPRAFWVRKSDHLPILSRDAPGRDGRAAEWVLVAEQP